MTKFRRTGCQWYPLPVVLLSRKKEVVLLGGLLGLLIFSLHKSEVVYMNSSLSSYRAWKRVMLPLERNNFDYLHYRLDNDVDKYTSQLIAGVEPDVAPVNRYDLPYVIPNTKKCLDSNGCMKHIRLLLVVKSTIDNFERRKVIRQTWGWEHRFPDVVIRCIFNLGIRLGDSSLQQKVEQEQAEYGDIIQGKFSDTYKNNSIKTMMGFRWVVENCPTAKFIMFIDDDMYVSIKNVLQYAIRPTGYPEYLEKKNSTIIKLERSNPFQFDMNDPPSEFFAGRLKENDPPVREGRKWNMSHSIYPFQTYPTYVSAGAYILSFQTLRKMYYTSMYTLHFIYDDVYLGMVAARAGIHVMGNKNFITSNSKKPLDYKYVIARHGFGNSTALLDVWQTQHKLQYA